MLLEFSVKNFLSFKDEAIFSLYASDEIKGHEKYNLIPAGERYILKTAAIYGANASGKSNLIKAMGFMRRVILNSIKLNPEDSIIPVQEYPSFQLHPDTSDAPIEMEVTFLYDDMYYRYGFVSDDHRIHREWLYYAPEEHELLLYERSSNNVENISEIFASVPELIKDDSLLDNTLLIAVLAKFTDSPARRVMEWVRNAFNVITTPDEENFMGFTLSKLDRKEYLEDILLFLKVADTGIEHVLLQSVTTKDLPKNLPKSLRNKLKELISSDAKQLLFEHRIFNDKGKAIDRKSWGPNHESAGTQKLFALSGPLIETLRNGEILVIDELDAKLHPMMMRFILSLFHSQEYNPHGAQLVFATHDTQLLSPRFFRRDQVWFTEKDSYGATTLYSLADFDLDDHADFSGDYFQGRYNAVPFIGDLRSFSKGVEYGER